MALEGVDNVATLGIPKLDSLVRTFPSFQDIGINNASGKRMGAPAEASKVPSGLNLIDDIEEV